MWGPVRREALDWSVQSDDHRHPLHYTATKELPHWKVFPWDWRGLQNIPFTNPTCPEPDSATVQCFPAFGWPDGGPELLSGNHPPCQEFDSTKTPGRTLPSAWQHLLTTGVHHHHNKSPPCYGPNPGRAIFHTMQLISFGGFNLEQSLDTATWPPSLVTVIWCVVICTHIFVDFTDTYLASAWIFVIEQKIQNYVISHSLAEWWKLSSIVCAHQLAHHYLFYPISLDVVFPPICLIALQTVIDDRRPQSGWKDVMRFCSWHNATPDISQCKGPVIISRTFSPEIHWTIQHTST